MFLRIGSVFCSSLPLGESHLISEISRLPQPQALWFSLGKLKKKKKKATPSSGKFKERPSKDSLNYSSTVILEKGQKRDMILTVLFRTSMLGNFLLMYLRDDSMDFSSKKGGLDLGSEQVCTDK